VSAVMPSYLLASLVWAFVAAPPVEPELEPDAAPDEPNPAPFKRDRDPAKDLPKDERHDPILPYGENPEVPELEYAETTPPPPELEYAETTPPPPELAYDQTRQRPAPADEALERESDLEDEPGQEKFVGRQASPQRFLVEIKFGPYLPNIDGRWTGAGFGPYTTIYGRTDERGVAIREPRQGLFSVAGFEYQFANFAGPISIGVTVGYFRASADALIDDPVAAGEYTRSTADRTVFSIVPVTVLLGYRFELLADRFKVPLVPYVRAGLAHGFWLEKKGGNFSTNSAGQQSRGSSWGWQANLGLMLRLDFIERAAAIDLDRMTGINHTYVFGEWQFSRINGFGSDKAMSVGADTFLVGLAIEF